MRQKLLKLSNMKGLDKDKKYLKDVKIFLKNNFRRYQNTDCHLYYSSVNGIKDVRYIPRDIFYTRITPILNKTILVKGIVDKINYDLYFKKSELPETIFKIISGDFYDKHQEFISKEDAISKLSKSDCSLVLKPAIASGAGKGIIVKDGKHIASLLNENKFIKGSYVIQKKLDQHHKMAKLHPSSLNTMRIMTARCKNKIVVLGAYLRMGINNSSIDNGPEGGIACGIDSKGKITNYAIDKQGNSFEEHPDSGFRFKNFTIPNYDDILSFCKENHKKFLRFVFISWDIAVSKNGKPIFIEFNLENQSIDWHQYFNGPIFGEYTQYFLEKYNEERIKGSYFV